MTLLLAFAMISAIWTGEASWYDDGPGYYGAVHSFRFGDDPYPVEVCRADAESVCVVVTVRDHMANPVRAIDLSPAAFAQLAPLSRGVVDVTVSTTTIVPPATDTDDEPWQRAAITGILGAIAFVLLGTFLALIYSTGMTRRDDD